MKRRVALAVVSIAVMTWVAGMTARVDRFRPGTTTAPPTFADDIAPIVYAKIGRAHV